MRGLDLDPPRDVLRQPDFVFTPLSGHLRLFPGRRHFSNLEEVRGNRTNLISRFPLVDGTILGYPLLYDLSRSDFPTQLAVMPVSDGVRGCRLGGARA